jgi:hypothetical protein
VNRSEIPAPKPEAMRVANVGSLDLSAAELKQLWWFLDGAIMNPETRQHLRRGWGLCPRHAWGYTVAEVELRGGKPFSTALLYEDLASRAASLAGHRLRARGRLRSHLAARESCYACEYVAGLPGGELELERRQWEQTVTSVNRRKRIRPLVHGLREEWQCRSCPLCLDGAGLVCRLHLVDGAQAPDDLSVELAQLARRLRAFADSLTTRRTAVGLLEQASWIEALGWFAGWDYPRRLELEVATEGGK